MSLKLLLILLGYTFCKRCWIYSNTIDIIRYSTSTIFPPIDGNYPLLNQHYISIDRLILSVTPWTNNITYSIDTTVDGVILFSIRLIISSFRLIKFLIQSTITVNVIILFVCYPIDNMYDSTYTHYELTRTMLPINRLMIDNIPDLY